MGSNSSLPEDMDATYYGVRDRGGGAILGKLPRRRVSG